MRLTLRKKLLIFAAVIAVLPLLIAGQTLIRIARDELKSSANDQLTETARQVTTEINSVYRNAWAAPLSLIANGVDNEKLSVDAKIALLTLGIAELPDIVALQITVEGSQRPLLVTREGFSKNSARPGWSRRPCYVSIRRRSRTIVKATMVLPARSSIWREPTSGSPPSSCPCRIR
ncbi:hypothetical protein [uncultured Roseibium sp.]|uniref:hypothetical protein n=1 Tax=uncultured Roseibium sp. TaxID=1936171 RepID=UPI0032171F15